MVSQQSGQRFRIQLRKLVVNLFDREEFRTLCFDLGLQYDDLRGETRESKVRELIAYMARKDCILELINYCMNERPKAKVRWEEIAETARNNPSVFLAVTLDRAINKTEYSHRAGSGIFLLAKLVKSPAILNEVIGFQKDFKVARTKIKTVNHYKCLHDLFQEMEASYGFVVNDRERLPDDESAWDSLLVNGLALQDAIDEIIMNASESAYATQICPWFNLLRRGQEAIQPAIEERRLEQVDTALRILYRALDRGLPRVNGRLVDAAVDLPLDNLVTAMTAIHEKLSTQPVMDDDALKQIAADADAIAELADNLTEMIINHNGWQGLADELRRVEANLGSDLFELELAWPDIRAMADQLYGQNNGRWATSLKRVEHHLEQTLVSKPATTVNAIFQSYRGQANRRFRRVDDDLLRLCRNIQKIGASLDLLLRTLH
jgi:hypothetical protein